MNSTIFPGRNLIPNWKENKRSNPWTASDGFGEGAKSIHHFPIKDQYIYFVVKETLVELRVKNTIFELSHAEYDELNAAITSSTTLEDLMRIVSEIKSGQTMPEDF